MYIDWGTQASRMNEDETMRRIKNQKTSGSLEKEFSGTSVKSSFFSFSKWKELLLGIIKK